jgi:hypothetical protein
MFFMSKGRTCHYVIPAKAGIHLFMSEISRTH